MIWSSKPIFGHLWGCTLVFMGVVCPTTSRTSTLTFTTHHPPHEAATFKECVFQAPNVPSSLRFRLGAAVAWSPPQHFVIACSKCILFQGSNIESHWIHIKDCHRRRGTCNSIHHFLLPTLLRAQVTGRYKDSLFQVCRRKQGQIRSKWFQQTRPSCLQVQ